MEQSWLCTSDRGWETSAKTFLAGFIGCWLCGQTEKKWIYPLKWKNISRSWLYLCSLIVPGRVSSCALAMLCACLVLNTEMRLITETFENNLNQVFWACMNEHPQQTIVFNKNRLLATWFRSFLLILVSTLFISIELCKDWWIRSFDASSRHRYRLLVALNNGNFRSLMILQNHMTSQSFIRHYDVFIRL